jgi:hypothetical protein
MSSARRSAFVCELPHHSDSIELILNIQEKAREIDRLRFASDHGILCMAHPTAKGFAASCSIYRTCPEGGHSQDPDAAQL